jgi:hypothetical protein
MPRKYVASRPRVPSALGREVRMEARHSCLVCRERVALVIHHIDGNRENNVNDNLVLVCANCHGMIHDGKISTPDLRSYKQLARLSYDDQLRQSIGVEILKKEFRKGKLKLDAFWDETFEKDIFSLKIGTSLIASIDDVARRRGAYILRTKEGASVGVIVNPDLGETYREFSSMLIEALAKSKFTVKYSKKGERFKMKKMKGERHYFEIIVTK